MVARPKSERRDADVLARGATLLASHDDSARGAGLLQKRAADRRGLID